MTENKEIVRKLLKITADSARYCQTVENAREYDRESFVKAMTEQLPLIYGDFLSLDPEETGILEEKYYMTYVDEQWYDTIRRYIENLLGPDDIFLETFEEDMKYSDTPIAASISEGLADIFQALYNMVMIVKESEGDEAAGAYVECRENFAAYWSQTLCNVLRALNNLRFNGLAPLK